MIEKMLTVEKRDGKIIIPESTMVGMGITEKDLRIISGRFYKKIGAWRVDERGFWDEVSRKNMIPVVLSNDDKGNPVSWQLKSGKEPAAYKDCDPVLRDYVRSLILHRSGMPPPPGKGHT